MASFLLGDKIAPKIKNSASNFVNPSAASIDGFTPTNFSLAGADKKQDELASRLGSTGQLGNFNAPYVGADQMQLQDPTQPPASTYPSSSNEDRTMQMKVIIRQDPEVDGGPNEIVFKVMPRIDEAGGAEYEPIIPVQHPGAIQKFRNSSPRTWSVSGKLISRTSEEASENLQLLNMIRSWRMPFFGNGTGSNSSTSKLLGAPPPILTLTAYGPNMIGPVKCVLTNYNWLFDNNLDYVPTLEGAAMPVVLDVNLSLVESWSPAEFSGFDITQYKTGDMGQAFQRLTASTPPKTQTADNVSAAEPTVLSPQDSFTDSGMDFNLMGGA